ncbi:restriction endonuclease subunit S domain-containing protein [Leucobacter celer]|uniref:restriction endonuclease subunit S n=1 Tax=Leucobacter celer TaxID=668625 RepID=UPI0006A7B5E0|nr:restriction endonuclease subunit S [Leucobacter celer]
MFRDLPRYSEMTVNQFWDAKAPSHWETHPGLAVLEENRRKNHGLVESQVLSLSFGRVVVKPVEKQRGLVPDSYESYQILDPGDIVIRPTDLQNDQTSIRVGQVNERGIITSAYIGLRAHGVWSDAYAYHYLAVVDSSKRIYGMGSGLRQQLGWPDLKRMPCLVPPPEEQAAIVRYLAQANARIDKAIAAKRRLIALVREQISGERDFVVRGSDSPKAATTTLPWIPAAPAGWAIVRTKQVLQGIEQGWSPQCDAQAASDDEWGIMKAGCSNYGRFRPGENKKLSAGLRPKPNLEIQHGDLLVSRANTRELVGSAAVALQPRPKLMFSDKTFRLKVRSSLVDSEFLALAMSTRSARDQVEAGAVGASHSMQNIGQGVIANLWIALPSLAEQREIVNRVHGLDSSAASAIEKTEREITLLQEFRTRLVADVVTGQVDVRAIAAMLPEAPEYESSHLDDPIRTLESDFREEELADD